MQGKLVKGYEEMNLTVRRFEDADAKEVANLLARNFKEVNIKD